MNILQNRIDSFKSGSVKWPHTDKNPYPKIDSYAKAGFYFVRRPKTPDTIRCFLCDKDLGNWKSSQSPFARHAKESPNCPWNLLKFPDANNKTLLVKQKDPSSQPRGSTMRAARLATFNNHNFWPPNKGLLSKNKRYPPASKLADAGFFFSPTLEQSTRIKCPYCKITITEPEKYTNILHEHQELSEECLFFEPTHHIRAAKNRRDTVDSTKSSESFKTANSELEESMDLEAEYSLYEPSFVESVKKKNKSKESDAEDEIDSSNPVKVTKPKHSDPIKLVRRRKVTETMTTSSGKRKREESVKDDDDAIWNIEQTFTPKSTVRKPVITFGNKKSRVLPSSTRSGATSVDIFANLKPQLKGKTTEEKHKKDTVPKKKSLIEVPKPATVKPMTRRKLLDIPKQVSAKAVVKDTKTIPPSADNKLIVNIPSSSTGSLKVNSSSSSQKKAHTDTPISIENIEPVVSKPYRDKGKGRAVEYNLSTPIVPMVKKPISLSKTKRLQSKPQDSTSLALKDSDSFILNDSGSGISNPIIPLALSEATYNQFAASSSHESTIPSVDTKQTPIEDMAIDVVLPDNSLNDLPETIALMETTPPTDFMDHNMDQLSDNSPEKQDPEVPQFNVSNRTPSPQVIQVRSNTPPPIFKTSTPHVNGRSFAFMQSTPNQESRTVNAFDIFGDCPISPIGPTNNSIYQDTPVMNGRTRNVIMKEPGGKEKLIHNASSSLPPPLDINNIQPAHITEKQKKMKVEEFLQGLIEQKIQDIKDYGSEEIKKIEAASAEIKKRLTAELSQ